MNDGKNAAIENVMRIIALVLLPAVDTEDAPGCLSTILLSRCGYGAGVNFKAI